jgi:hypothetical protein
MAEAQAALKPHRGAQMAVGKDGLIVAVCRCGWRGPFDLGEPNTSDYLWHVTDEVGL